MTKGCPFIGFKPCVEDRCYFYYRNVPWVFSENQPEPVKIIEYKPSCLIFIMGMNEVQERLRPVSQIQSFEEAAKE